MMIDGWYTSSRPKPIFTILGHDWFHPPTNQVPNYTIETQLFDDLFGEKDGNDRNPRNPGVKRMAIFYSFVFHHFDGPFTKKTPEHDHGSECTLWLWSHGP